MKKITDILTCIGMYWPIYLFYLIFETAKAIFTELKRIKIPVFIACFMILNWIVPLIFGIENILILRKIFIMEEWRMFLMEFLGFVSRSVSLLVVTSFLAVLLLALIYILPAYIISVFVYEFAKIMETRFEWDEIEKIFQVAFSRLHKQVLERKMEETSHYRLKQIGTNLVFTFSLIIMTSGVCYGGEYAYQKVKASLDKNATIAAVVEAEAIQEEPLEETSSVAETEYVAIITADAANIRKGPGKEHEVIETGYKGESFRMTGKEELHSSGTTWYEIYLTIEGIEKGWVSQKVIEVSEND